MRNPFRRRQKRESVTSQLLRAWTLAIADGGVNDPRTTSVGEAIAREYEAALAEVQSNHPALDPEIMGCIGRQLAVRGEWVGEINVVGGSIRLQEAADWDVTGDTGDPNSWMYQLTLPRPSGDRTEVVLGSGVVHLKYSTDPRSPWRGISPFDRMSASSRAVGGSEARFAEELASAVGFVVPVPATPQPEDDDDESGVDPLQELASDLRSLEGRTSLVETTSGGWGDGMANRPMEEWRPRRMGADPSDGAGRDSARQRAGDAGSVRAAWRHDRVRHDGDLHA